MPSYPCGHPTCTAYVGSRGDRCPEHAGHVDAAKADRQRRYDRRQRDRDAKRFYDSAAWGRARAKKLADFPVCERCGGEWSRHVHHVKPLRPFPELALDQGNLMALCPGCHGEIEAEGGGS